MPRSQAVQILKECKDLVDRCITGELTDFSQEDFSRLIKFHNLEEEYNSPQHQIFKDAGLDCHEVVFLKGTADTYLRFALA